ncbi:MAG: arginine--tRNA ligase, partial [Bacteroidetes bacterium]|nr:arginine--tRNA ligase [Bacteroidota bacterium]
MEKKIKELLLTNSLLLFGSQIEENQIQFQITRKDVEGDFTLVTFPFSKLMCCSPADAAEKIGEFLKTHLAEIEKLEVINGFLNICLNDSYWIEQLNEIQKSENFGFSSPNSKPLYMVEY